MREDPAALGESPVAPASGTVAPASGTVAPASGTVAPGSGTAAPVRPVAPGFVAPSPLVVYGALMSGTLVSALSQTVVASALPTIVGELGGMRSLSWVITATLLASTISIPLFGKASDVIGRKGLYQASMVVFLAGSVLAAASTSIGQLISARVVQGIGGGGLMALSQAILADLVAPRERARYMGYMGAVFAAASVGGPALGGVLVDQLSWRWCFLISVPAGVAALVVTGRLLRLPRVRTGRPPDIAGALLLGGAASCAILAASWGGTRYAWGSATIGLLITSAVALSGALILRETRAADPVLPLRMFRSSVFTICCVVGFLIGLAMFGSITFLPLFMQVVTGVSATSSGVLIFPAMLGFVVSSVVSGRIISRTGRYKRFPVAGIAVMGAGLLLLSSMDAGTSRTEASLFMAVLGLGAGMVMQVLVLVVQNQARDDEIGIATSSATFFRSMGGAFGVAIFGSILNAGLQRHLGWLFAMASASGMDPQLLEAGPRQIHALPAPIRDAVVEAFARSIQPVFRWSLPGVVLALLLIVFLREVPLRERESVTVHP